MKKRLVKLCIAALFIGAMGIQTYIARASQANGDTTLNNVEALAGGESGTSCTSGPGGCVVGGSFVLGLTLDF